LQYALSASGDFAKLYDRILAANESLHGYSGPVFVFNSGTEEVQVRRNTHIVFKPTEYINGIWTFVNFGFATGKGLVVLTSPPHER